MEAFEVKRPTTIAEALELLGDPGVRPIAGGTSLVDLMKLGVERPKILVDISLLPLKHISLENNVLTVGALATSSEVAADEHVLGNIPAVSAALLSGASGQIRNAATIGGNILQATRCPYFRSTTWPCNKRNLGSGCSALEGASAGHAVLGVSSACMAAHPSDLAVALVAAGAKVHLASASTKRCIPLEAFYRMPGSTPAIETVITNGELLCAVEVALTPLNRASRYIKLRSRTSFEFASVSVAGAILFDQEIVTDAAIALGGLSTIPWRDRNAEEILVGQRLDRELITSFCNTLLSTALCTPENQYKLPLAANALQRTLLDSVPP
ncbi:FAD binding domain-containing protein [Pelagibacterium sediminicola]|uniref:FAD binding domain-containing protein n=1 Tax=Pelagibacterium sediminicola TaxID=2248761 RepID=UPI000E317D76|nr:xanthine dehydrogenase family protein subunit M [Pelagibacterium sediminicola]